MGAINQVVQYSTHLLGVQKYSTKGQDCAKGNSYFATNFTGLSSTPETRGPALNEASSHSETAFSVFKAAFKAVGAVLALPFKAMGAIRHYLFSKQMPAEAKGEQTKAVPEASDLNRQPSVGKELPQKLEVNSKKPRPPSLNIRSSNQDLVVGGHSAFDAVIQSTRRLGHWNSEAGDVAINWLAGKPAMTDGRRICIINRHGELSSDTVSRDEAPGGEDIYLMLDGGHYSPVKLTPDGYFDLTPTGDIKVVSTPADGNCFYRALLSELSDGRVTPEEISKHDIQAMRNVVADTMLKDRGSIEPFL